MGLLTAPQKAAIADDPVYRQVWYIAVPVASGSPNFVLTAIHDDDGGPYCVIDPGNREMSAYNVTMKEPGKLSSGLYRVVLDNSDGEFYPGGENWKYRDYDGNLIYQANNVECRIYHYVYVRVDGAWSSLSFLGYVGRINQIDYDDDRKTATLTATMPTAVDLETEQELNDYTAIAIDCTGLTDPIYGSTEANQYD